MRYNPFILVLLYSFFLITGSVYGIGEKIISLGSAASWGLIEKSQGISEISNIRPNPVLALSGGVSRANNSAAGENSLDLHLSFDEGHTAGFADSRGRYDVIVSPELGSVSEPFSRIGAGAAHFTEKTVSGGYDGPLVLKPRLNALFAPGSYVRDFSIEFWLFPQNMDTGEQVFLWTSANKNQRIQCFVSRNKLQWTFNDFFFSPGGKNSMPVSFSGPLLLNRTWSHHLIRFDADLGLLEYLVDGWLEVINYASSTGREGGEVYTPVIGDNCRLVLGGRFSGLMDEFRIYRSYVEKTALTKYPAQGGHIETRTLDLGRSGSQVLKIEAFGGRTTNAAGKIRNEYAGNGLLRFPDHAELKFFIRVNNSPYRWNEIPWMPFNPGAELSKVRGRFIQLAVDFYPSGDGETSPYLSELKIIYNAAEAPPPPAYVAAAARDGAVDLSWRASPSRDVGGYFIYYGTSKGEYFEAKSPIDAGNRTSIRIDNLNNGTLYYFVVAAYSRMDSTEHHFIPEPGLLLAEPGEFSREVAVRPLRMAE